MSEEIELNDVNGTSTCNSSPPPTQAEKLIKRLNASNAKKVALLLVLGFVAYHGILNWSFGSDSCQWLLSKGRFKGNNEWQPYGCMMHKYTQTDTRQCLRYLAFWGNKNQFAFIGDSSVQRLYQAFINHLNPYDDDMHHTAEDDDVDNVSLLHSAAATQQNAHFEDLKLNMNAVYIHADEVSHQLMEKLVKFEDVKELPAVFIVGFTNSQLIHGNMTDNLLKDYRMNLTRLVTSFDRLVARKSKVLWKLQEPVNEEKLPVALKQIQNKYIERLNSETRQVLRYSDAIIWQAAYQISCGLLDTAIDGYKLNALGERHEVELLLNMYCNDYMNYNDGTCCSSAEPYTSIQIISYAVLAVCFVMALSIWMRRCWCKLQGRPVYMPLPQREHSAKMKTTEYGAETPLLALGLLGLIMAYFYLCDRTNFFMKENKYYSEFSFWIPVGYVFALGLFFTEESRFTKVLNRDQTDETKGWILLVVLIYYMTGAHRVLSIHMHIKLLLSGFMFLTGYSHFTFIWQTGSQSHYVRFFQVMFRLNFITIVLCFCMNRPYQFYYFVPLLSFWTCVIYFVLCLPPRITVQSVEINALHYLYLVLKFVGCISVITVLFMSEVFFERIFVTRPWKALFVSTDDDIHEWWYQWKLDRYTVTFGMIFGACFQIAQKYFIFDDNNHGNLFARGTSITATLLAMSSVAFYTIFTFLCRNKQNCEEIHSYLLFIPIIGFIILRNISGILRTRYSTFFAWFGRISLELFICQYHIWLAADRHGVLVLLPGFPTLNMIITSFIFICASHEVHRITNILMPYAVPNDWKSVTRNFIIFLIILLPIGHYDGMF